MVGPGQNSQQRWSSVGRDTARAGASPPPVRRHHRERTDSPCSDVPVRGESRCGRSSITELLPPVLPPVLPVPAGGPGSPAVPTARKVGQKSGTGGGRAAEAQGPGRKVQKKTRSVGGARSGWRGQQWQASAAFRPSSSGMPDTEQQQSPCDQSRGSCLIEVEETRDRPAPGDSGTAAAGTPLVSLVNHLPILICL